ncbi:MAG TPA: hypothetical protein ENK86_06310 [Campylobacterales bacterium]|nr:hypothetical protein [Campylobacterales bacterium]
MKKLLLALALLLPLLSVAETPSERKAVFDCSSDDMDFVSSRMWLIAESAKEYQELKVPYQFVLTIHSGCTEIMAKESAEEDETIAKIQQRMEELSTKYKVSVEGCQIAIDRYGYAKKDLLPFITPVRNSITRVINLENEGYALITFD